MSKNTDDIDEFLMTYLVLLANVVSAISILYSSNYFSANLSILFCIKHLCYMAYYVVLRTFGMLYNGLRVNVLRISKGF